MLTRRFFTGVLAMPAIIPAHRLMHLARPLMVPVLYHVEYAIDQDGQKLHVTGITRCTDGTMMPYDLRLPAAMQWNALAQFHGSDRVLDRAYLDDK